MFALCYPKHDGSVPRGIPKFGPKVTHPLLISASKTFDRKLRPNGEWELPSLFLMVSSLTPYDLPFTPKWGFHLPPIYANGYISATGDPIHFMFGSRVGYSGTADRTALFMAAAMLENFKWPYLRNRSSDPLHVLF